ncbi:sensor domain-containing protein [Nocardioides sp.]|uniref:sensor domain-containing protein n=1 Tax=Nocardioides sp. TaxID=35761 RepID=UPI002724B377|nr:sensor domain-containing protein [Nocardioides sp.]MDO9455065.1 sensor domain-containing protein [Nocardioides sp.]
MDQTLTSTRTPAASRDLSSRPTRRGLLARLGRDTAYVVSGFALGVVGFAVVVTGLAAGLGLVVVWVGLAVLAGTLLLARGLAHLERWRMKALQDREVPPAAYVVAPAGAGALRRLLTPLRDPQSWLDALWALVSFVTGTVALSVVASWWATAASGLTYWWWQRWLPEQDRTLVEILGLGEGRRDESLLQLGFGVVALLTLPLVVRGCAALHAGTADALLNLRSRQLG